MSPSDTAILKKLQRVWMVSACSFIAKTLFAILLAIGEFYVIWLLLDMEGVIVVTVFLVVVIAQRGFNQQIWVLIIFLPIICVFLWLYALLCELRKGNVYKLPRIATLQGFTSACAEAGGYRLTLDSGREFVITPSESNNGKYVMQCDKGNQFDERPLPQLIRLIE